MVPHFVLTPSFVVKEWEPLLIKIFQFLRLQPRSESEGGSRDVPEPILNGGTENSPATEGVPIVPMNTLCATTHCVANGTNGQPSQQSCPTER